MKEEKKEFKEGNWKFCLECPLAWKVFLKISEENSPKMK